MKRARGTRPALLLNSRWAAYADQDRSGFWGEMVMVDYAWADPGERIKTGQISGRPKFVSASASGSLELLALGASGLIAWRGQ